MYPPCISPGVASEGGDLQTINNIQKLIHFFLNMLNGLFCLNVECKRDLHGTVYLHWYSILRIPYYVDEHAHSSKKKPHVVASIRER